MPTPFPPGLAMGQVNDRVRGHEIDAEAGIAIVAGFAGAGTVEDQVGRGPRAQRHRVLDRRSSAADAIAEIDAAVVAGALTRGAGDRPARWRRDHILIAARALPTSCRRSPTYVDADAAAGVAALGAAR